MVTGGLDGIGEQYCKDLAKQGFNICVIARNKDKINEKLKVISEGCGRVIETRSVIADFSQLSTIEEYERIADEIKDLDIGILILNAGVAQYMDFLSMKPSVI